MRNGRIPISPLKAIFLWVKLRGIEWIVFSLHCGNELQSLCIRVYREKLPELIHLKPGERTPTIIKQVFKLRLLSKILSCKTPVVEVDSYWQGSKVLQNIIRGLQV